MSGSSLGHGAGDDAGIQTEGTPPSDAGHSHQSRQSGNICRKMGLYELFEMFLLQAKQELSKLYECPVYKTRQRG